MYFSFPTGASRIHFMARSNFSIYVALASNVAIAITKFIAGSRSHSSAMISEGIHSLVDCSNELLLLLGIRQSNKQKDKEHPFGYGRELYFWSFIIAILIFALGAGISFYQGIVHIRQPRLSDKPSLNFIVLGFSLLFDGGSFLVALRAFNKIRGDQSLWAAIRNSKDPSTFLVLLEDFAAVVGIFIVAGSLALGHYFHNPYFDGIASLLIGCLLTCTASVLARESRSLLMGEGISAETEKKIIELVKQDPAANFVQRTFSIYQSPQEVLVVLIVSFKEGLTTAQINQAIERIKKSIAHAFGRINYIVIEPFAGGQGNDGFTEQNPEDP